MFHGTEDKINCNCFFTGKDIKMVRLGHPGTTNRQINEFSLPILAERHVRLGISEFLVSRKIDLNGVCLMI